MLSVIICVTALTSIVILLNGRRRSAEMLSRQLFAELATVGDFAPVGLCFLGLDLKVSRCNDQLLKLLGTSGAPEDHAGTRWANLNTEFARLSTGILRSVIDSGGSSEAVEILLHSGTLPGQPDESDAEWQSSTSTKRLSVSAHAVHISPQQRSSAMTGIAIVVQDITEIVRQRDEAQRANEQKSNFLANMSQ